MPEIGAQPSRLRFLVATCARFATRPWLQRSIAPEDATSLFACSFGNQGWHHLRKTLAEYDEDPAIEPRSTTLYRYLKGFRPQSISALADPQAEGTQLPLFVYPWGTFRRGEIATRKDPWTSRFCGPSTDEFAADEFHRTIGLYVRMKREGYRPASYGNTYIGGTFLVGIDGSRRFVVLQGNHRMAILAHLGVRRIDVRNVRGWLTEVREADAARWPLVLSGQCSERHARQVFRWFFDNDGHHVERAIGGEDDRAPVTPSLETAH